MSGNVAFADTSLLTTADGWTKITSISQTDIANNYYVFVDNDADLMLGLAASTNQTYNAMFYQASTADVINDLSKVWILEVNGDNYGIRNLGHDQLQLQTEWASGGDDKRWRQNDQVSSCVWTGLSLAYADGKWTLTSTQYSRPLGVYNDGTDAPKAGDELGANSSGKGASFQIYAIERTKFLELYKASLTKATADAPRNATLLLTNQDFIGNSSTGWSGTTSNMNFGGGAAEFYHPSSFDIYQTLTGLANGKYQVSVQMAQEGDKTAQLYATTSLGTQTATVTASTVAKINNLIPLVSNGIYLGRDASLGKITVEVTVSNGELTLGLKDADPSNHWVVFDNFTMTYLGAVDISDYVTNYTTALDAAKAVNQESPMNKDVLAALNTALSSYGNVDRTSQDALVQAINALSTATTNANASIEAYASAKAAMDNVLKFIKSTNFYTTDALNTYKTNDYTTPMAKYEARTLTDAEAKAVQDPYAHGGYKATRNVWALLRSTWADASFDINTWSTEGDNDGSEFVLPFVQWFVADKSTLPEGTKSGTLGGLNAGKVYEVTANTRVRMSNNQTEVKGVTMDVNGGSSINLCDGSQVGSSQLYLKGESKVYGLVGDDGNLTINFNASSSNTISWLAFKDVNYKETDIAVLNEDGTNTITAAEDTKIGVKRSFKSYVWNSVVLPFDLNYSQVQAIFGNGTKTAEYTGATSDDATNTVTLNFTTAEGNNVAIKANTPCLVRPTKTMTFAVAEGVNVVASTAALTVDDALVSFEGSYNNGELKVTDQDFFLSDDNKLYRAQGGETVKGFRAIFRLKSSSASDAKFNVAFDDYGETTAIAAPAAVSSQAVNVYNLAGQLVKKNATSLNGLQKGLYVVNGKKVVVK